MVPVDLFGVRDVQNRSFTGGVSGFAQEATTMRAPSWVHIAMARTHGSAHR